MASAIDYVKKTISQAAAADFYMGVERIERMRGGSVDMRVGSATVRGGTTMARGSTMSARGIKRGMMAVKR